MGGITRITNVTNNTASDNVSSSICIYDIRLNGATLSASSSSGSVTLPSISVGSVSSRAYRIRGGSDGGSITVYLPSSGSYWVTYEMSFNAPSDTTTITVPNFNASGVDAATYSPKSAGSIVAKVSVGGSVYASLIGVVYQRVS